MNTNQPKGPYQLNPIQGLHDTNRYKDFRPAPGGKSEPQERPATAFSVLQEAKAKSKPEVKSGEPRTAFELEAERSRRPLGATESAPPSEKILNETSETTATAEKEKPSAPTKTAGQASSSAPKSGHDKQPA